uniref:Uncharacterized protein n=1 Tax=Arundo donax TaxID=35708 RepID=A0A0A9APY4_ARUDO
MPRLHDSILSALVPLCPSVPSYPSTSTSPQLLLPTPTGGHGAAVRGRAPDVVP